MMGMDGGGMMGMDGGGMMGMDGGGMMGMDGGGMMGMDGGGMMGMDGGGMMGMDGGAGGIAHDVGQGAGNAAGNVASGAESAARGVADAGAAAYGAASSAASGAATTAADAARDAASGARSGAASAMDGGASAGAVSETPGTSDAGTVGSSETAGTGGQLSDAQIAAIAVAANKVDIEAGQAARKKTKNARVKKFAADMIRDHGSANKQAAALVKKLGVTPEENEMSRAITQGGKDNLDNLKSMKGKEFDRAYAEHEVAYHQQVLDALDQKLIPSAQNAELKSLLQSVRAVIAQHLEHATIVGQGALEMRAASARRRVGDPALDGRRPGARRT